jgi:hypothetical protein
MPVITKKTTYTTAPKKGRIITNKPKPKKEPPVNDTPDDKVRSARKDVDVPDSARNTRANYDTEVKYTNMAHVDVNVTRVKESRFSREGINKGPLMPNASFNVCANDEGSTLHAIKKRCDHPVNTSDPANFLKGHKMLMEKVPKMETFQWTEELFNKYLDKCKPAKADRLRKQFAEDELHYDASRRQVFAKAEATLKAYQSQPRAVWQGTDMHNMLAGPIAMELNERIHHAFSRENPLNTGNVFIYACGMKKEEIGEIIDSAPGETLESDAKNNDGSQSGAWRKYEAMFYKKLGAPDWFVREFANNTQVTVWTRYGVSALVKGQRWSGENTTTTGNSYVNMCDKIVALDMAKVETSTNIFGGDDFAAVLPTAQARDAFAAALPKSAEAIGMVSEVCIPKIREGMTFYRTRYAADDIGEKSKPIPQFGRVLEKLPLRGLPNPAVNDRDYMAGKLISASYEHRYVPVIGKLLNEKGNSLSPTPHFDREMTYKMEGVKKFNIDNYLPLKEETLEAFTQGVYGVGFGEVSGLYGDLVAGIESYLDEYTEQRDDGTYRNKPNDRYKPPILESNAAWAVVLVDCPRDGDIT